MRKLVVHMQTTLDGRISRPDGLFWEPFPWGEPEMAYLNGLFQRADTWAMTRKLYEFVIPYWEQVAAGTEAASSPADAEFARIQNGLTKLVFSHTLADDPATRRVVRSGDIAAHLRAAKQAEGADIIASVGPATLGPLADEAGLVDEYLLVIHPAVLADGPRLFDHITRDLPLRLADARVFDGGAAVLRYASLGA